MGHFVYLKDVVTLSLNAEKCTGCGTCEIVCPHGVLRRVEKKVRIVDRDACMECGACATNCRAEAIRVQAGVGCATAVINGMLTGGEPSCGCGEGSTGACC